MKKSLKNFFENSRHPELYKKVWELGGVNFKDFKAYPNDYYAANTGAVTGLIYYADTEPFAKENIELILELIAELMGEGILNTIEPNLNWLTWLTWESMAGDLINYLEE